MPFRKPSRHSVTYVLDRGNLAKAHSMFYPDAPAPAKIGRENLVKLIEAGFAKPVRPIKLEGKWVTPLTMTEEGKLHLRLLEWKRGKGFASLPEKERIAYASDFLLDLIHSIRRGAFEHYLQNWTHKPANKRVKDPYSYLPVIQSGEIALALHRMKGRPIKTGTFLDTIEAKLISEVKDLTNRRNLIRFAIALWEKPAFRQLLFQKSCRVLWPETLTILRHIDRVDQYARKG